MMPPNMALLAHGTAVVLALNAAVSAITGVAMMSPLMALNAFGFIGACALASAVVFLGVAIERAGFDTARAAATALVSVLAWSALAAAVVLCALFTQSRFRDEASRFGFHSVVGIGVLVVFVAVLAVLWRDRWSGDPGDDAVG